MQERNYMNKAQTQLNGMVDHAHQVRHTFFSRTFVGAQLQILFMHQQHIIIEICMYFLPQTA